MIINKKYLAKYSPLIPSNYNFDEIMCYVDIAEKIWIVETIGYDWYEELQEQVEKNELTEENATALVEAIYPYLAMAVSYEALPMIWTHASEIGLTKGHSDSSESLSLKELTLIQDHVRRQLEARKDYCVKWLCEHRESFPLLNVCSCGCSSCNENEGKLNRPNPQAQIWSTRRKNTNLF